MVNKMVNKMLLNNTVSIINVETFQEQSTSKNFMRRYKVIF
jgi:hypothetical protein